MRLFVMFAILGAVFSFEREALDNCDDLGCLSQLMTREDGLETVPAKRDGFMSAWLRYNKAAADLRKQKKKAKEQEFGKRAVGNLYGGFKNKKNGNLLKVFFKYRKLKSEKQMMKSSNYV